MKKTIEFRYVLIGWLIAATIGYIFSVFLEMSFWVAFLMVAVSMYLNGLLAEYEDNLAGGFNNPIPEQERKGNYEESNKKLLSLRIAVWVSFLSIIAFLVFAHVSKSA